MENAAFISKFHNLPEELKQQVLEFMDNLLSQLKQEEHKNTAPKKPELPKEMQKPIAFLSHKGMLLPITPASEKADFDSLSGIWKNKDITLEKLRHEAWGGRL